jgi:calcineurin-like phosphoesterase family protein
VIYFTADLHFGHSNINKLCARPFSSVDEMDNVLIRNWNRTVAPNDDIYILGDFSWKSPERAHNYVLRLSGHKFFIRGNHDKFLANYSCYSSDFEWVKDYHVLRCDGRMFVLFHYPIAEWDGFYRDAIHLYGHVHNSPQSAMRIDSTALSFNVGVDTNEFTPVSIAEISRRANDRKAQQA